MKQEPSSRWERLASVVATETAPLEGELPFGFTARLLAKCREARREEGLRRWSFLSLRAACASMLICGTLAYLRVRDDDEERSSILISPPAAEFVAVPLSSNP